MRKSLFTIDGFEAIWEGYTDGMHWNGWAKPWFTKEVGMAIVRVSNKINDEEHQASYNADTDTFIFASGYDGETDEIKGYDIDGLHLYPIGNGFWIWDNIAEYQSDQTKKLMEYLLEEYFWLGCENLYAVYYGICQEIDGYMTDKEVKIFADGFMTAFDKRGK